MRILALVATFAGCSAAGAPQVLLGAEAGLHGPGSAAGLGVGPSAGLEVMVRAAPRWAARAGASYSLHRSTAAGKTSLGGLLRAGAGLQFRFDVGSAVPYAFLGALISSAATDPRPRLAAQLGLGALFPLGEASYLGFGVGYGYAPGVPVPSGWELGLKVGLRTADF